MLPALRELAFFQGCTDEQILALAGLMRRCRLQAGDFLCRAEEPAAAAWIVVRGSLEILSSGGAVVARIEAGEACGLTSLFLDAPSAVSIRACEETWLFEFDRATFLARSAVGDVLGALFAERVARLLAARLRGVDAALDRLEAPLRPRARDKASGEMPATPAPAPAAKPASPSGFKKRPPDTPVSDEELQARIDEAARRAGIEGLDQVRVVQPSEKPIRGTNPSTLR
jgi:CRP-like cAMP-binding protein